MESMAPGIAIRDPRYTLPDSGIKHMCTLLRDTV